MPAAAIPFIVGGIGAAGSVASGLIGSSAAGHAADTQAAAANNAAALQKQAADEALAFQKQQYGNSLNLLSPFYNTGVAANSRLSYLMGLSPQTGLPSGVINPNSPAPVNTNQVPRTQAGFGGGFNPDVIPALNSGGGQILANRYSAMPSVRAENGAMLDTSNLPVGFDATTINSNPQLQTGGTAQLPGGGFGVNQQLDPNDPTQSNNPLTGPNAGLGINPAFQNPDLSGLGATVANGSPGQVPRTGTNSTNGGFDPGGFGSLAQGFNEQFTAPTDVTEQNDPGYKFRLQQGMDALQRSAAARGGLLSGGTAKDINDYAQNQASSEYGNVYNRSFNEYTNRFNVFKQNQADLFNRLSALTGGGQVSAGQLSNAGLTTANNAGNILLGSAGQIGQQLNNAAAARGSGYVGSANAIGGAIQGGLNSIGTAAIMKILQGG